MLPTLLFRRRQGSWVGSCSPLCRGVSPRFSCGLQGLCSVGADRFALDLTSESHGDQSRARQVQSLGECICLGEQPGLDVDPDLHALVVGHVAPSCRGRECSTYAVVVLSNNVSSTTRTPINSNISRMP